LGLKRTFLHERERDPQDFLSRLIFRDDDTVASASIGHFVLHDVRYCFLGFGFSQPKALQLVWAGVKWSLSGLSKYQRGTAARRPGNMAVNAEDPLTAP
jgi:hypothetical protein